MWGSIVCIICVALSLRHSPYDLSREYALCIRLVARTKTRSTPYNKQYNNTYGKVAEFPPSRIIRRVSGPRGPRV